MKRLLAIILIFTLLFSCAGCVKAYTDQAPTLYITMGEREIERKGMIENYQRRTLPFLKMEEVIFCYPFAMEGDIIPIEFDGDALSFRFDEEPKAMWLQYYKEGDVSEGHITEAQAIKPNDDAWPLQRGKNIYELFATWENAVSGRTARYVFCIVTE